MSDTAAQPREDDAEEPKDPPDADESVAAETDDPSDTDGPVAGPVSTGAESVVAALEAAGAETAFGVQGGAIMPVYDALYDSSIRHVTMAHEQGAAHAAADAYGVVAGEPGLCLATSGPGATNLVTGIADADMDSDAMLALTGQVPTEFVGNDAFQETDTVGVTRPITKHNYFANGADTVGDTVGEVRAVARGPSRPTLVDLPKDVTQAETEETPGRRRPGRNRPRPERRRRCGRGRRPRDRGGRTTRVSVRRRRDQGRRERRRAHLRTVVRHPRDDDDARHRLVPRGRRPLSLGAGCTAPATPTWRSPTPTA